METLGKVRTVAFDKTGTLTVGRPKVTDVVPIAGSEDEVLANAAAAESGSSHPLGVAIIAVAEAKQLALPQVFGGATAILGKAVTARLRDGFVSVGSPRYAAELRILPEEVSTGIQALEADGKTVVVVIHAKRILGMIALQDEPREDAAAGIVQLKELGTQPVMLTGDNKRTGEAIGRALGLKVQSELLPDAKLAIMDDLKKAGPVAMIGDGINDAPALATANVGVAMGSGTDVALETAEAALLRNRVTGVAELIALSRATLKNIWQIRPWAQSSLPRDNSFRPHKSLDGDPRRHRRTVLVTATALRLLRFFRITDVRHALDLRS